MGHDCLDAQYQDVGDLLHGLAFGDQLQDLLFAVAKYVVVGFIGGVFARDELATVQRLQGCIGLAAGQLIQRLGAGVAGLQAIATARRLGAVVEAFDVRPAAKEQVQSLGATFVDLDLATTDAQDAGGYAKELAAEHIRREKELLHERCVKADIVITTALVPGKRAPVLVPASTVAAMRFGSVIVDLAGEMGGNCELSTPGKPTVHNGVTILAPLNLASDMAFHASTMYSKNVAALLEHLAPGAQLKVDLDDEITRGAPGTPALPSSTVTPVMDSAGGGSSSIATRSTSRSRSSRSAPTRSRSRSVPA